MGLVQKELRGRSTLFSSKLSNEELKPLKLLLGNAEVRKRKSLSDFSEMDLPLVGEFPEFESETAQSAEELLVKVVVLAKKNSSLLRTLPLLVKRMGTGLSFSQLAYWSKRLHVDRELGFVLDLTEELSKNKKLYAMARRFRDKRWSKYSFFLEREQGLLGFQARVVEQNTPQLAKKWFLKMNMGLDSFQSHYFKFA